MPQIVSSPARAALALAVFAVLASFAARTQAAPRGGAAADPPKSKPPGGSSYHNPQLGVRAQSPRGWKMVADKGGAPASWERLVTFNDTATDAQVTLSVRPRAAATIDDLLASVRADWDKTKERLPVSSMRQVPQSALNSISLVIVDGSFRRKAPPAKDVNGVPAPPVPDVTYRVQATYYLGPGYTYLLYAQGQDTHWSRLRPAIEQLRESIKFDKQVDVGPKGEGSYRSEAAGFTCQYPKDFTVVTPQRGNHLIEFTGVAETDPVLGVYGFKWEESVEKDAERLVTYYEQDKGGTASATTTEVSGQQGMLVTAKATLTGQDRLILIAVVKRGDDCFRLRASMPVASEAAGTVVFRAFVASFRLTRAP